MYFVATYATEFRFFKLCYYEEKKHNDSQPSTSCNYLFSCVFCVLSRRFSSYFVSDVSQKSSLFFCVPTPLSRESFRTKGIILVFVVKPVHVRFFSSRFFLSDHFQVLVNTYGNVAAIYRRCPPPVLPSTPCIKVLLSWGGLVLDYNYAVCG